MVAPKNTTGAEIDGSRLLLNWLVEQQLSLAITTYQSNRLLLVGVKPEGQLTTVMRTFDRIMGLWATPDRLTFTTRHQLWHLTNSLKQGEDYQGRDRLYHPRQCYYTGEIDAHDLVIEDSGRVVFVNTLHSCLTTPSDCYSFTPLWQPPFISKLAPEDRCHLNGLALRDGQARYVSICGPSDVTDGWRDHRQTGGCIMDIHSNEVVLQGLSMPHSPRWYQGKLWLINSGTGEFGYADLDTGQFEPVTFCPGYGRGLAFWGDYAVVGLSMPREKSFTGLQLDQQLSSRGAAPRCGLLVIDLNTGDVLHWLRIGGLITELYDVQIIPGVTNPSAISLNGNEMRHRLAIDPNPALLQIIAKPASAETPPPGSAPAPAPSEHNTPAAATATLSQAEAEQHYRDALALQKAGDIDVAFESYQQLLQAVPGYAPAHYQLAKLHQKQQQISPAIVHYREALKQQPNLTTAWFNLGVALQAQKDTGEAIAAYQQVIQLDPNHLKALNNLGILLESEKRQEEAIACYRRASQLAPEDAQPVFNLGRLLAAHRENVEALPHLKKAHALVPDSLEILLEYERARLALCDWQNYDQRIATIRQHIEQSLSTTTVPASNLASGPISEPVANNVSALLDLNFFAPDPALHRIAAERYAQNIVKSVAELKARCNFSDAQATQAHKTTGTLRLGYISPDFRDHAVGMLTHQMFQHHNREMFEVIAYSLHPKMDHVTAAIQAGCDAFVNLAGVPTEEAARRIHNDGIHILIDLAGYTGHSRSDILALQPAPLQIQYLGYPGTLGAEFVQVILADEWLIPPEISQHYSEQVAYLPQGFVASPLPIAKQVPSRAAVGLPEVGMVYAAFHNSAKLDPAVFGLWMRILDQVEGSVLWLSDDSEPVKANLRQAGQSHGIDPARLVFAPRKPLPEYLAQYRLADLFLDTFNYGAGSTAVCAVGAGLPLLTCLGQTYASRMGASVLASVGLEELICESSAQYEQLAARLGQQRDVREALHQKLAQRLPQGRDPAPLFDTQRFVEELEATLLRLWQERYPPQLC